MRSVVVSDLHLGVASGVDLLRHSTVRERLIAFLEPGDRFVVLGDGLELRQVPVRAAAAPALALLREVAGRVGPNGSIVMMAGNHDHGLVAPWIEARLQQSDPPVLSPAETVDPSQAGPLAAALAEAAAPAGFELAYPGLWLRDDVYAIHGHYLDLHTTVPTFERLIAGAMARWVVALPQEGATPDDYESALAPLYAWLHALAQRAQHGAALAGAGASSRAWVAMAGAGRARRPLRAAALGVGYSAAVAALNRLGVGPVRRDLSGRALRQGALHGMSEVVARLGIDARHVLFGHSHRAGPLDGDDQAEWRGRSGARLMNTGSWVFQPHFLTGGPGRSPYWPGSVVVVEDDPGAAPRLECLLADLDFAALRGLVDR